MMNIYLIYKSDDVSFSVFHTRPIPLGCTTAIHPADTRRGRAHYCGGGVDEAINDKNAEIGQFHEGVSALHGDWNECVSIPVV